MVLKNETQGNYLVVSQSIMHDKTLKLFDRGLLVTLMSLPDNWNFTIRGLAVILCDGRDAIAGGLKRLQDRGYLVKEQLRDNGQFSDICLRINMTPDLAEDEDESDMSVYEMTKLAESFNEEAPIRSMSEDTPSDTSLEESVPAIPMSDKPLPEKPSTEMPLTGKPVSGNPTQLNNKESNIQESNNHKSNTQGYKGPDGKGAKHGTDSGAGNRADKKGFCREPRSESSHWSKDEIDLYGL